MVCDVFVTVASLIQLILTREESTPVGTVTVQLMLCTDPVSGFCVGWYTLIIGGGTVRKTKPSQLIYGSGCVFR